MYSTQTSCPHCGSALNFAKPLVAGAPVDCLICMQTFTVPVDVLPIVELAATVGAKKSAPPAPPLGRAVTPTRAPVRVSRRSEESVRPLGRFAFVAVSSGLIVVLIGAIGFAVWKLTNLRTTGADHPQQIAKVDTNLANPPGVPTPATPSKKVELPAPPPDDEDTRRLKDLEKKQLTRKASTSAIGSVDLPTDPVIHVNGAAEPFVGLSQLKINIAIEKGIAYLKRNQNANGSWANNHPVGHASIGGLTLLECQVHTDDLAVQRAARFVRGNVQNLTSTYDLSLAILFLDRLNDTRDRSLIQGMALRLLAGQNDCGGWTYNCPLLSPLEMFQLYTFLQVNKRANFFNPVEAMSKTPAGLPAPVRAAGNLSDPFQKFNDLVLSSPVAGKPTQQPSGASPNVAQRVPPGIDSKMLAVTGNPLVKAAPIRLDMLPANLRGLPVVKNQGKGKGQQMLRAGGGDNSNTQFAILAIWAARRHDLPSEQAILAAFQRFNTSQNADGGWGYMIGNRNSKDTMTCVGLLGEAMGHGTAPEIVRFNPNNPRATVIKPALEDPRIQDGLKKLAQHIGDPLTTGDPSKLPMQNLYFLWSVERVAMLYDLKTINGKEWYPWGAQILVHHQRPDGDWGNSQYPGACPSLDTCFALLFLKRSNLVQDLTNNLRLYTGISDPQK